MLIIPLEAPTTRKIIQARYTVANISTRCYVVFSDLLRGQSGADGALVANLQRDGFCRIRIEGSMLSSLEKGITTAKEMQCFRFPPIETEVVYSEVKRACFTSLFSISTTVLASLLRSSEITRTTTAKTTTTTTSAQTLLKQHVSNNSLSSLQLFGPNGLRLILIPTLTSNPNPNPNT